MSFVGYEACQLENNQNTQVCFSCLSQGPTAVDFAFTQEPIGGAATSYLVTMFGRLHGHVLLHSIPTLESYHCFVN